MNTTKSWQKDEKMMKIKQTGIKRIFTYVIGMMIYTYGVCLMTRANIGISPVTSIAHILMIITGLTLGKTQLLVNIIMVCIQILWLKRRFPKIQILQLAASLLFSVLIDWIMPMTARFAIKGGELLPRIGLFLLSMLIMGFSLALIAMTQLVLLPADGVARVISQETGIAFGTGKIIMDSICVIVTLVISFLILHRLESVNLGTVAAALCLGSIVKFATKIEKPVYEKWIGSDN